MGHLTIEEVLEWSTRDVVRWLQGRRMRMTQETVNAFKADNVNGRLLLQGASCALESASNLQFVGPCHPELLEVISMIVAGRECSD